MTTHEDGGPMSDIMISRKRHHEYTYRLPTPPRIVVPPPTLSAAMPELTLSGVRTPEEEIDMSFLKETSLDDIVQKNTLLEWTYERRREAQMIVPWLYLGPLTAAKDIAFLRKEGITMVLAIRSGPSSMNATLRTAKEACHEIGAIEAANYFSLVGKFSEATRMINQHVATFRRYTAATGNPQLGKVLVFCESGNEKSAAVVAAYLMETLVDFDYIKSMQVCQAQRFCVNFDDTIKTILHSYWDILQARRIVAGTEAQSSSSSVALSSGLQQALGHLQAQQQSRPKIKRTIEDTRDDEDDVEMGDGADPSDALRFAGRDITPFMDG